MNVSNEAHCNVICFILCALFYHFSVLPLIFELPSMCSLCIILNRILPVVPVQWGALISTVSTNTCTDENMLLRHKYQHQ
jgi:hypothetical protein